MNLTDPFNRRLSYLRLSVTDLCNYRCNYCLPNGYQGKAKPDELTLPEIETLAAVFAQNGTRKIRITGGEPTLRRDLPDIIAACRAQPEIQHIALTTNAFKLGKLFPQYRAAGLDKLNVSIDSFNPETFFKITGKQECRHILNDLENILAEGFNNIKINTLLLREHIAETLPDAIRFVKTRPVTLRFIELMQTGDNLNFFNAQHISAAAIEQDLIAQGWQLQPRGEHAGPAREYYHRDFVGGIGFIAPYSKDFCNTCNRLRITSQGKMHLCLFGGVSYDLRDFLRRGDREGLTEFLHETMRLMRIDPLHPDHGLLSFYLMNIVHMQAGEGIFQRARLPHAYLRGQNIELMAASNNVLRAGLTPKHIDIDELLRIVDANPVHPAILLPPAPYEHAPHTYSAPVDDYTLSTVRLRDGMSLPLANPEATILLNLEGRLRVTASEHSLELRGGEAAYLTPGIPTQLDAQEGCYTVIASSR